MAWAAFGHHVAKLERGAPELVSDVDTFDISAVDKDAQEPMRRALGNVRALSDLRHPQQHPGSAEGIQHRQRLTHTRAQRHSVIAACRHYWIQSPGVRMGVGRRYYGHYVLLGTQGSVSLKPLVLTGLHVMHATIRAT